MIWDTTPEALRKWRKGRSAQYEDAANASLTRISHQPSAADADPLAVAGRTPSRRFDVVTATPAASFSPCDPPHRRLDALATNAGEKCGLKNPMGASLSAVLSEGLAEAISKTATPESEAPSMSFHVYVESRKKASGTWPYPEFVEGLREVLRERSERPVGRWSSSRLKVALTLWKLLCFVRIHGVEGLERWIARKLSVSHAWRRKAARRTARRLYRESRRRGRVFSGLGLILPHRIGPS